MIIDFINKVEGAHRVKFLINIFIGSWKEFWFIFIHSENIIITILNKLMIEWNKWHNNRIFNRKLDLK